MSDERIRRQYKLHINKRGEDTVRLAGYGTDKPTARLKAREMAELVFPGATITGGAKSDAFVAKDGDEYLGTVSVERPD